MPRLTKNVITREEAIALAPAYVKFIEDKTVMSESYPLVMAAFEKLKKGQKVVTFSEGIYVRAKVTSINSRSIRDIDGPVVRVGNDEYTWRVDGNHYAYPIDG